MIDRRVRIGILIGLAAGVAVVLLTRGPRAPAMPPHGPLLSDCDGALRSIVIQYVPEAAPIVQTAYAQLLAALPADVAVYAICPDAEAFADLRARLGPAGARLKPVAARHPITCWSRDRWLAFGPARPAGRCLLMAPAEETAAAVWPQRAGDARTAFDLARGAEKVAAFRSPLAFDGGDFGADDRTVFVTPEVARRNVGTRVRSTEELVRMLEDATGKAVVLLDRAPLHHAGMFMMAAGNRTVLVGDPSVGARAAVAFADPDFSAATQALFDAVADRCVREGYRVVRMPLVPAGDGRTWLTWLNVLIDARDGRRTVYMPVYDGAQPLNDAAEAIWRSVGHDVVRIDCTQVYPHSGSLHCLVNVLQRDD